MAYVKTDWKARQGKNLNKFTKYQETSSTVILENSPDSITEPGTSFNVERMNKIEQGIYDAHGLVAAEAQDRQADINDIVEKTINIIGRPNGIASLDGQAKVPLEQLPEVFSEDFTDLINAISTLENNILEKLFPVGCGYIQGINDPDPYDAGFLDHWQWALWTHRAEQYCLTPATSFPNVTKTYTGGQNYSANEYVKWHLPGSGWEIFKANSAITNAATQLNPILWTKYVSGNDIIVDRRDLQGWLDDDFAIGHVIRNGDYAGKKVSEVITLGGTFPSWEGGNRPTFNSGIAPDVIRNITGSFGFEGAPQIAAIAATYGSGPFTKTTESNYVGFYAQSAVERLYSRIAMNLSLVVPTGLENSPRNHSCRFYRRVI